MKSRLFSASLAMLVYAAFVAPTLAQTSVSVIYNYASIAFPGASLTSATGINNSNVIVGYYFDSADVVHGFVYRQGQYIAVNVPGATTTEVLGVNDNDDLVGYYVVPPELSSDVHGFIRRNDGTFKTIDFPGANLTVAYGINKAGTIVGTYDQAHGFVYQNGTYKTLDAPQLHGESPQTQLNGIDNFGRVVGQVFSGGHWRGFWIAGKDIDFLEPLATLDNQVTGINGRGDIVGCHDFYSGFVSFHVENSEGRESSEEFPARQHLVSCASAINFARVVVGINFGPVNQETGFLAVPALTLRVASPVNQSILTSPVHVVAAASGNNPIKQIQVWVNFKKVFQVNGATLDTDIPLPVGNGERFVVQAIDSKGIKAKVANTISVQ